MRDLVKATVLGGVWYNGEGSVAWSKSPSIETLPCIHIEDLFYGYLHNWPPIGLRLASDWSPIGLRLASTVPIHKKALAFNGNRLA